MTEDLAKVMSELGSDSTLMGMREGGGSDRIS